MADSTIKEQTLDAISSGKSLLTYDMGDLIYSFGESLSRTGLRLGKDYLEDVKSMIYTENSLKEVAEGKREQPEVAYIKAVFDQPVMEPNGVFSKRQMEVNIPRFLAFQKKPLDIADAKVAFDMTVSTVFQLDEEGTQADKLINNNLSLNGSMAKKTTVGKNVTSNSNLTVEVNFKIPDEANPIQEALTEIFKGVLTPISV